MNDRLNITSIKARLKLATPPFWKRIRRLMIGCGALGIALAAIPAEHLLWVPVMFQHVDSILITIGVVGTGLSSFAAVDPKD